MSKNSRRSSGVEHVIGKLNCLSVRKLADENEPNSVKA